MNKRLTLILVALLVGIVAVSSAAYSVVKYTSSNSCSKEANCCIKNEDCKYVWFVGGCNTPEYVSKKLKDEQKQGIRVGEAAPRDNVTCTCERSACVTHN